MRLAEDSVGFVGSNPALVMPFEFVRDVVSKVTFEGRTGEGGEGAWVAFHGQDRQDLA